MCIYVISDIHGCYEELLGMLDKISFSDTDQLIIAGDYIDRGCVFRSHVQYGKLACIRLEDEDVFYI